MVEALTPEVSSETGGSGHATRADGTAAHIRRPADEWLAAIDAVQDGVALIAEGTLLRCNRAFAEQFGLDVTFSKGRSLHEVLEPLFGELGTLDFARRRVRSTTGKHFELTLRPAPSWVGGATLVVRDISDAVRADGLAAAIALVESSGLLVAGVVHELRNPVASLSVGLSMLEEDSAAAPQLVPALRDTLDRLEFVIVGLRAFQAGEDTHCEPVELSGLVERVLRIVRMEAGRRAVALQVEVAVGLEVLVDARALFQVLLNLVANGLEALAEVSTPILAVRAQVVGDRVELDIADNGPGMNAAQRARAFAPFETSKPLGTGLGLFVVRRLMTAMEGSVDVHARADGGTTMRLSLRRPGATP